MKKSNKGFTLVELLAVIVVLAIIMIIAVPAVLSSMDTARRNTFIVEARKIVNAAMATRQADDLAGDINAHATPENKTPPTYYCYRLTDIGIDAGGKYHGTVKYVISSNTWQIRMSDGNYITKGTSGWLTISELNTASNIAPQTGGNAADSC